MTTINTLYARITAAYNLDFYTNRGNAVYDTYYQHLDEFNIIEEKISQHIGQDLLKRLAFIMFVKNVDNSRYDHDFEKQVGILLEHVVPDMIPDDYPNRSLLLELIVFSFVGEIFLTSFISFPIYPPIILSDYDYITDEDCENLYLDIFDILTEFCEEFVNENILLPLPLPPLPPLPRD